MKHLHQPEHDMHDVEDPNVASNSCIASCFCDDGVIVALIDVDCEYEDRALNSQFYHALAHKDGKILEAVRTDQRADADRAFLHLAGKY